MTHIVNRKEVRRLALVVAQLSGRANFTRVSACFLDSIEAHVRATIRSRVHRHPSIGKTLKGE